MVTAEKGLILNVLKGSVTRFIGFHGDVIDGKGSVIQKMI